MTATANRWRGEALLELAGQAHVLRPSFAALVAAEEQARDLALEAVRQLGAHDAQVQVSMTKSHLPDAVDDTAFAEALVAAGLAQATKPLRGLLAQVLQGRAEAA